MSRTKLLILLAVIGTALTLYFGGGAEYLAMGLTAIRAWTFYWVSQLGMLAGTFVYVNAGRELGQLESLSGSLSWRLLLAFAALGLLPLIARKFLNGWRAHRVYNDWNRPKAFDRDGARFGITTGKVEVDFGKVMAHVRASIRDIAPHDSPSATARSASTWSRARP